MIRYHDELIGAGVEHPQRGWMSARQCLLDATGAVRKGFEAKTQPAFDAKALEMRLYEYVSQPVYSQPHVRLNRLPMRL